MAVVALLGALLGALVGALVGCRSSEGYEGRSGVMATYRLGTLTSEAPDEVRVPAVIAAADAALRARGYGITSKQVTEDRGWIRARPPGATEPEVIDLEDVTVWSRVSRNGTKIGVDVKPIRAEAQARAVLDDVLRRLGR